MIHLATISISRRTAKRWLALALKEAESLELDPALIPDEQADVLPTGELRIFVKLPGREIEMLVPRNEWAPLSQN